MGLQSYNPSRLSIGWLPSISGTWQSSSILGFSSGSISRQFPRRHLYRLWPSPGWCQYKHRRTLSTKEETPMIGGREPTSLSCPSLWSPPSACRWKTGRTLSHRVTASWTISAYDTVSDDVAFLLAETPPFDPIKRDRIKARASQGPLESQDQSNQSFQDHSFNLGTHYFIV